MWGPVLVVLDLPQEAGLRLCQSVKTTLPDLPVIILTPQDAARIKAVLRRQALLPGIDDHVHFGRWVFDRVRRRLAALDGSVVYLSPYEGRLLSALVEHPCQVLTRQRLLELSNVSGVEVTRRSVDLAISRLRAKLGDSGSDPAIIRTIRGEGYLFERQPH